MVKFLHTADWQMGAKSQQLGSKAGAGRKVRLQSVRNIVSVAKRENVDFVLIAGDIFEDPDIDESVVRSTVEALNDFEPVQVFMIPGNHDPFVPGGVWDRTGWKGIREHVHLLTASEEFRLNSSLAIYPCPLKQKMGKRDPTEWIPSREEGDTRIRIGLAHGSLDIVKEPNFPIAADRLKKSGLNYLALGDWHGFFQQNKAVYPGTPEQTSYTDKNPGNVVVVTIVNSETEPIVQTQRVGILNWVETNPLIQDVSDIDALEKQFSSIADRSNTVLKVRLKVSFPMQIEALDRLKNIRGTLSDQLWYLDWPEDYVKIDSSMLEGIPAGMLEDVRDILLKLSKGENLEPELSKFRSVHDPETAAEALRLLYRLSSEGRIDDT
jgi:DNA repair exonuclease SbcCD nuclease subunit